MDLRIFLGLKNVSTLLVANIPNIREYNIVLLASTENCSILPLSDDIAVIRSYACTYIRATVSALKGWRGISVGDGVGVWIHSNELDVAATC